MPCLAVTAELCQVTQIISGENQPELVRQPAHLLFGKPSRDRSPVLERGALQGLGCASMGLGTSALPGR